MKNLKIALAAACAAVVGWAFTASADDYSYTLLEYLDGAANTYVDTGIKVTETMEFRFRYAMLACTAYHGPFGTYMSENNNTTRIICSNGSTTKVSVNFMTKAGGGGTAFADVTAKVGDVVEGYMNYTRARINRLEQDLDRSSSKIGTADTSTLTLFGRKDGYSDRMRIYSFRAYDDGAITHYYAMARRSDGTLGVYDLVTKEFKPKTGGGDFTAGPEASGLRLEGDTYQYRVSATATANGTVAIGGGTAGAAAETWQTVGDDLAVTVTATPGGGTRFVRWDGDVENLTVAERTSPTLTRTVSAPLALTAVFAYDLPASAYVQNGLVAQFDGIDNAGTGTHDATVTTWKDLTGHGYDATPNANVVWTGDHWENANDGQPMTTPSTLGGNFLDGNLTVEFCAKPSRHSSRATFVGQYNGSTGYGIEHVASSGKIRVWINGSPDYTSPATLLANELGTIAAVSSPTEVYVYKNGALGGSASGKYTGKPQNRAFVMGGEPSRANMGMRGSYYACRFYNRHLTADEIAYNANIDKIRFEQADPATLTWPDGYKYEDGKIKAKMTLAFGNAGGGGFLVDGEPQTAGDVWLEVGKEVQVTVVPEDLYAFGLWEDSADLLTAAEKTSTTIAVRGAGGHRVLTAKFRCVDPSLVA